MPNPRDEGENFRALEAYVEKHFPESHARWTEGDPTIPGSHFQAHVVHSGSRIVRGGLWLNTRNGSSVEEAAGNLLTLLKQREETGMQELEDFVKKEGYEEKGFIIEIEGPSTTDELYRVSVHLNTDFRKQTHRDQFVLGTTVRKSPGVGAREVLSLLQFKKSKGYTWVDETLFREARIKHKCESEASRLLKQQKELRKRGEDLMPAEIDIIKENELVPHVTWLGSQKFHGPPDFFSGQLPKLSEEIHKVLKENGYLLDPVSESERKKVASLSKSKSKDDDEGRTVPPKPLVAYEAVETYERLRKEKAQQKAEAKENSKISRLSRRLGLR